MSNSILWQTSASVYSGPLPIAYGTSSGTQPLVEFHARTGVLYEDAPQQLCSVYLVNQQPAAGQSIAILSLLLLAGWLWHAFVHLAREANQVRLEPG